MKHKKPVTNKVLLANRANAQKSTGPRNTDAVKQNARKHGLLSTNLHFKNEEEKEAFQELVKELEDEQKSAGPLERVLVEDAAISIWKLRTTNGWDIVELINRRKAAKAVLKTLGENYDDEQLRLLTGWDERQSAATRGWDCQELVIRTGTRSTEQEDEPPRGANSRLRVSPENGDERVELRIVTLDLFKLRPYGLLGRDPPFPQVSL